MVTATQAEDTTPPDPSTPQKSTLTEKDMGSSAFTTLATSEKPEKDPSPAKKPTTASAGDNVTTMTYTMTDPVTYDTAIPAQFTTDSKFETASTTEQEPSTKQLTEADALTSTLTTEQIQTRAQMTTVYRKTTPYVTTSERSSHTKHTIVTETTREDLSTQSTVIDTTTNVDARTSHTTSKHTLETTLTATTVAPSTSQQTTQHVTDSVRTTKPTPSEITSVTASQITTKSGTSIEHQETTPFATPHEQNTQQTSELVGGSTAATLSQTTDEQWVSSEFTPPAGSTGTTPGSSELLTVTDASTNGTTDEITTNVPSYTSAHTDATIFSTEKSTTLTVSFIGDVYFENVFAKYLNVTDNVFNFYFRR